MIVSRELQLLLRGRTAYSLAIHVTVSRKLLLSIGLELAEHDDDSHIGSTPCFYFLLANRRWAAYFDSPIPQDTQLIQKYL